MNQNINLTYNQIIYVLSAFTGSHIDLERFEFEDFDQISEITSKDEKFPMMFAAPVNNQYDWQMNKYSVRVFIYDRITKDRSNINNARSRTNQICADLDVWLRKDSDLPIEIDTITTAIPFSSELMDYVTGWEMTLTFEIPSYGICKIPFDGKPVINLNDCFGTGGGGDDCPDANYIVRYENNVVLSAGTISAGGEQIIIVPDCPECRDVEWELYNSAGTLLDSGYQPAGTQLIITAPDSNWELQNSDGDYIFSGTTPSGGSSFIAAPDATITLTNTVPTVLNVFDVPSNTEETLVCPNSVWTLINSSGTTISTGSIPAGANANILAPNANWILLNTAGTNLGSGSTVSNGNSNIIAPNVNIQFNNATIQLAPAGTTYNFGCNTLLNIVQVIGDVPSPFDGFYKTDGSIINGRLFFVDGVDEIELFYNGTAWQLEMILSPFTIITSAPTSVFTPWEADWSTDGINMYQATIADYCNDCGTPDPIQISINGDVYFTTLTNVDIFVVDEDGVETGVWDPINERWVVSGSTCPPAPVGANVMKTNQTSSFRTGDDGDNERGRATDFFTLAVNNPFGNTNRFTDLSGGTAYTNSVVIDWSTYDGARALGYHVGIATSTNWNNQIDNAVASTHLGYNDWRLANIKELCNIANLENGSAAGFSFNYAPINMPDGIIIHSSTTNAGTTTQNMMRAANGNFIVAGKTSNGRRFDVRYFTNANLGI